MPQAAKGRKGVVNESYMVVNKKGRKAFAEFKSSGGQVHAVHGGGGGLLFSAAGAVVGRGIGQGIGQGIGRDIGRGIGRGIDRGICRGIKELIDLLGGLCESRLVVYIKD